MNLFSNKSLYNLEKETVHFWKDTFITVAHLFASVDYWYVSIKDNFPKQTLN